MSEETPKIGRPSKFDESKKEIMEKLYKRGFTDAEVAEIIGVTDRTINNWKIERPSFFQSLKDWKVDADRQVERALYERACGYNAPEEKQFFDPKNKEVITHQAIKHFPPDPTSMIFWLKNRQPKKWRDKQEVENTGEIKVELPNDKATKL